MKIIKIARKRDSNGISLGYMDEYVLRKKKHGLDDPYFLGGGSLHAPEMVFEFDKAARISGEKLEFLPYDWERDWVAIAVRTPSPEVVFGLKPKK